MSSPVSVLCLQLNQSRETTLTEIGGAEWQEDLYCSSGKGRILAYHNTAPETGEAYLREFSFQHAVT